MSVSWGRKVTRTQSRPAGASASPTITVIMANYQGGRYIERALDSVLGQTFGDLEVLVSDDASPDDSVARVAAVQARDPRVQLIAAHENGGPARCRNRALEMARGTWIAIVDSDDLIHPERFERLLAAAGQGGSDIVADDLLHFHEDGSPSQLLLPEDQQAPLEVSPRDWILAGRRGTPPLGYLKPMIRRAALDGIAYDETLRIGEDYDLMLRLLLAGARLLVVPEPWYFYRRHKMSFSHRLSVRDLEAMIESQRRFLAASGPFAPEIASAFATRQAQLRGALDFELMVDALKGRRLGLALAIAAQRPSVLPRLARAASQHFARGHARPAPAETPASVFLSADASASSRERLTIRVPAYGAPEARQWGGAARRSTWRRIADLGQGGALDIAFDGPAGAYAAGFIPAAMVLPHPDPGPSP